MRVVYLVYSYGPDLKSPEQLLERYITVRAWAEALSKAGAGVTVIQRFWRDAVLEDADVTYKFVADSCSPHLRGWEIPRRCHGEVAAAAGDDTVVHFNGLLFPMQLQALRSLVSTGVAIVAQHHAERPWPRHRRFLQRAGLKAADGFLFASAELASAWRSAGLIGTGQPCFEVMECPMQFQPGDKHRAREATGIGGNPVVLWVGNLNERKDPLTVLAGFEMLLAALPAARLYMVYAEAPLLNAVRDRIGASDRLRGSVALLGSFPHDRLQDVYSAADYFVLGSHSEGSGYALAEAMSCGVVPVVTDIPSFRTMTAGSGTLWRVGSPNDFARALLEATRRPLAAETDRVLSTFRENLGPQAVARNAIDAYEQCAMARYVNV